MVIHECHVLGIRIGIFGNDPCSFLVLLNKQQGESPKKSSPERGFKPWPKKCFKSALFIYVHVIVKLNVIISLLVSSFKHWRVPIFFLSGDFFLAELIESQDETNKCVVADVSWNSVVTKLNKRHKSWNECYTRKAFFLAEWLSSSLLLRVQYVLPFWR